MTTKASDVLITLRPMNPAVNWFFDKESVWQEAYAHLRTLALNAGLREELKWGHPCYTLDGKNVVLIHGFKDYCALLFMQGALLSDAEGLLVQQTKNVQSARQLRFTSTEEIERLAEVIAGYLAEAGEVARAGSKVATRPTADTEIPVEFQHVLDMQTDVAAAFRALTPGRQRGYLLHFAAAKQAATRLARVERYVPKILAGQGLND